MRAPRFRGDIQEEADRTFRMRELLRGRGYRSMPSGPDGFIVEDLDLLLRWKGPRFNLDDAGRFRLIEVRRRGTNLDWAKEWTFGLIHFCLRAFKPRYDGFYVVQHDNDDFDRATTFWVNGQELTADEFLNWCLEPFSPIPSYKWRVNANRFKRAN